MNERIWDRSMLLTAIAVTILSGVSVWFAWHSTTNLLQRISLAALAPIACAAIVSYSLRIARLHYFLRLSGVAIALRGTAVVQAVGFALSVTPGHLGEVFKLHLIRERTGTPVMETAPILLLDRLTEGGGFMILALAATLAAPQFRSQIPSSGLLLIGLGVLSAFALAHHFLGSARVPAGDPATKRRIWQRLVPYLRDLWRGFEHSFTLRQLAGGLALSTVARFSDGLVVFFVARMLGVQVALPVAVLVLAVSGLAGGISFLPAGTGAVETTMIGLLVLSGVGLTDALGITLISRMFSLWGWVAYGLAVAFAVRLARARPALVHVPSDTGGKANLVGVFSHAHSSRIHTPAPFERPD